MSKIDLRPMWKIYAALKQQGRGLSPDEVKIAMKRLEPIQRDALGYFTTTGHFKAGVGEKIERALLIAAAERNVRMLDRARKSWLKLRSEP